MSSTETFNKRSHQSNDDLTKKRVKHDDTTDDDTENEDKSDNLFYGSEVEEYNEYCRNKIPQTLPHDGWLCKHCRQHGQLCSRIRFGKYVLKRTVDIEKCLEWKEAYLEFATIYYEASEFARYTDNASTYEAKYVDIQDAKENGTWEAEWVPRCVEELFYAFKHFHFDNCTKKGYEYGEKSLKKFLKQYDVDNKML